MRRSDRHGRPEVLAPAGSPEALIAAVRCGADAVDLGAGAFNARRHAQNFDTVALREAVSFCHARGTAVHLTLNTLVREDEMSQALAVAQEACELGIDALIIQDVGLAGRIREAAPDMPLHASTQLSCHNPAGVDFLREAGFSRVVLAREMSREEIAACAGRDCELEVFVHGALCMCVSGQCYFSAMLGGRSGNRGLCAQPCRLPFSPEEQTGGRPASAQEAALSLKDSCLQRYVGELAGLGVSSLKIEGRMKRPEYVAAATTVYRAAVDGRPVDPQWMEDLQAVFSRTGFTDGYYTGERTEMFGVRRKEDVAAAAPVLGRLAALYEKEQARIPVRLTLRAQTDQTQVEAADPDGRTAVAIGTGTEPARVRPLDPERAAEQLRKTGGTPFCATETEVTIAPGQTLPLSEINALRREALDRLLEQRGQSRPIPFVQMERSASSVVPARDRRDRPLLTARVARPEQCLDPERADRWILPLTASQELLRRYGAGGRLGVEIPRGLFGTEEDIRERLVRAKDAGAAFALCGNVGAIPLALAAGLRPVGSFGLNVCNAAALQVYAQKGLTAATISMELTFRQMAFVRSSPLPVGAMVYGRQPLMLVRNCPRRAAIGSCRGCDGRGSCGLIDRKGMRFGLTCSGGCTEVLNAAPLYWADRLEDIPPLDFWLLHFTDETADQVADTLATYRSGGPAREGITRGLYRRGVD